MIAFINKTLKNTPLKLHPDKIDYRTTNQKVYITGVKLNKDHQLTYGHEKTEQLKRDIFQTLMAMKNGHQDIKENQELIGRINYAMQIQPDYIKMIVSKYSRKFQISPDNFYKHLVTAI